MIKHKVLFLINSVHYFCNSLYNLYKSYDKTELSSEHKEIKCLGKSIYFKVLSLDFTKKRASIDALFSCLSITKRYFI